jgi:hypothetical protein
MKYKKYLTESLQSNIKGACDSIRNERKEHRILLDASTGETLFSTIGSTSKVDLSDEGIKVSLNHDVIDIHNHPDNAGPSDEDWKMLGWSNVKKMIVVTRNGDYSISRISRYYSPAELKKIWRDFEDEIFNSGESKSMTVYEIIDKINKQMTNATKSKFEFISR